MVQIFCRFEIMAYHLIQEHNTAAVKFYKLKTDFKEPRCKTKCNLKSK